MKSMLDKVEREEKRDEKHTKKHETPEEKMERYRSAKLIGLLFKQKDSLHREMLKKRSVLEKSIESEIRVNFGVP